MTYTTDAKVGFYPDKRVPRPCASVLSGPGVVGASSFPSREPQIPRKASERGRQRWQGGLSRQGWWARKIKKWHKGHLSSWHSIAKVAWGRSFESALNWNTWGGNNSWLELHVIWQISLVPFSTPAVTPTGSQEEVLLCKAVFFLLQLCLTH